MAMRPLSLWNHWSIQILVLLSLTLQVFLLFLAGIRRGHASGVWRLFLWLAYQLADSTAMYAIGHLSLGVTLHGHHLVAFWAPFLLLHLGGADSISAYALEDNQLWLRHLQALVVQVLGAAYVLYKHASGGGSLVLVAAILMMIAGVFKYAERVYALKRGNLDSIRRSLEKERPASKQHQQVRLMMTDNADDDDDELYVRCAHTLFHVCKRAMVDYWVETDSVNDTTKILGATLVKDDHKRMWALMEVELSLMYDVLYTKAAVIHTWHGYCIRAVTSIAAAASFFLFWFSGKDDHSAADIAVTYTLLSGAFLLETASLLGALGSAWAYSFLCTTRWAWLQHAALCRGRWDRLRRAVKRITSIGGVRSSSRRWSGKMGQYNMLHLSSRRDRAFVPLVGRLAKALGREEWWLRKHYSGAVEISDPLKKMLFWHVKRLGLKGKVNTQGVIRKNWGQGALQHHSNNLYRYFKNNSCLGVEFQEGIIIWHIGTDVYLARRRSSSGVAVVGASASTDDDQLVEAAIRTLSNYMVFLLVEHPYMLPGLGQNMLYRLTRENLIDLWRKKKKKKKKKGHGRSSSGSIVTMLKELFRLHDEPRLLLEAGRGRRRRKQRDDDLANALYEERPQPSLGVPRLHFAYLVADKLLERAKEKGDKLVLDLLLDVWMDFLVYAANRCSRESHAKKLSRGGELTTILWLMTDYIRRASYGVDQEA